MNIRQVANSATSLVNPNTLGTIFISTGFTIAPDRKQIPTYAPARDVLMQVQALTEKDVFHTQGLNIAGSTHTIYVNGRLDGLVRRDNKGGDIIEWPKGSGRKFLVTALLEDWPDWCKVAVTLQQP